MSILRLTKYAALATLACAALMQAAERDRLHLPVAAHWGSVLLPPGDYSLALPDNAQGESSFSVEGSGKTMRQIPLVTNFGQPSQTSWIILQKIDGHYFVREFSSGRTGKSFVFSVPKTGRRQQTAAVVSVTPVTLE